MVDRISTVGRSLQGSPFTGSDPTRRSLTPARPALMANASYTLSLTTPSSLALERSKEEVGFRPLKVTGRPLDKGSVDTTHGHRLRVVEMGENLGQERIIESHTVGPEVQGIQTPVEALSPVERIGVAPAVNTGLAPQNTTPAFPKNMASQIRNKRLGMLNEFLKESSYAELKRKAEKGKSG